MRRSRAWSISCTWSGWVSSPPPTRVSALIKRNALPRSLPHRQFRCPPGISRGTVEGPSTGNRKAALFKSLGPVLGKASRDAWTGQARIFLTHLPNLPIWERVKGATGVDRQLWGLPVREPRSSQKQSSQLLASFELRLPAEHLYAFLVRPFNPYTCIPIVEMSKMRSQGEADHSQVP